jgi:hypothetical protein
MQARSPALQQFAPTPALTTTIRCMIVEAIPGREIRESPYAAVFLQFPPLLHQHGAFLRWTLPSDYG